MKNRILLLSFVLCLPLDAGLISSFQTALPGQTVTFEAELLNIGADTQFLNGTNATVAGPLTIDDTPFFLLVPATLAPGGSYTGPVFQVIVPFATAPGIYTGTFDILGGASSLSQDLLYHMEFGVQVVPEPASLLLLLPALAGLMFLRRKREAA